MENWWARMIHAVLIWIIKPLAAPFVDAFANHRKRLASGSVGNVFERPKVVVYKNFALL